MDFHTVQMLYLFGENDGVVGLAPASPDSFKLAGQFSVPGEGPKLGTSRRDQRTPLFALRHKPVLF